MKNKIWIALVVVLAAMALACGSGSSSDDSPVNSTDKVSSVPSPAPTKAGTIGNGSWRVGKDVKAGEYRALGAEAASIMWCNWSVESADGTPQSFGNSAKRSEPQLAKLEDGWTFNTSGCAVWVRQ